jgi:hypothetical protein
MKASVKLSGRRVRYVEYEILLYDLSLPLLPFVVMIMYQESITAVGKKIPGPDAGISFAIKKSKLGWRKKSVRAVER